MLLYQRHSETSEYGWEEFVCFRTDPVDLTSDDIIIRRNNNYRGFQLILGGVYWNWYGSILPEVANMKSHFTFVIAPNKPPNLYKDGIFFSSQTTSVGDIPVKKYNIQNIGGNNVLLKGSIGNFRFYDRELSATEIFEIGSIGTTSNDLVPFNITRLFKAEERQLIKVDKHGKYSTFGVTSNAPYDATTNLWNINSTNNVSFNDEQLINGGAFTIMFLYQRPSSSELQSNEEFVSFRSNSNEYQSDDIIIRRNATQHTITVDVGGITHHYYGLTFPTPDDKAHFTIVVVPNSGVKVYKDGNEQYLRDYTPPIGDVPANKYNYQNIGGTGNRLFNGILGNFRFYDRELSSAEILSIGSIGKTSNDLDPFMYLSSFYSEANLYNFYGKNADQTELLTKISSYGNLHTIGTISNGSDDRIKSHEVEIQNATNTLLKLTPKIYDKHPFVKFSEDQEDNDLENVSYYKKVFQS